MCVHVRGADRAGPGLARRPRAGAVHAGVRVRDAGAGRGRRRGRLLARGQDGVIRSSQLASCVQAVVCWREVTAA